MSLFFIPPKMYLIILTVILTLLTVNLIYNKYLRWYTIDGIGTKAVMITGCDSGLGLELAKHVHSLGFVTVATCLDGNSKGYQTLITLDDRCKVIIMDITRDDQVEKTVNEVQRYLKLMNISGLYGLVNNAGVLVNGEFDWLTWPQIKTQIDVNLTGSLHLTKLFLDNIINNKGRLVYVSSLVSNVPFPLCTTYCSTKSGLAMFAEGLQTELGRFGVKIILLQPGDFTKLTDIISVTVKASKTMWDSFDDRRRRFYGNYFSKYYSNMIKSKGIISYKDYNDSTLYTDIEEALTSHNPRPIMIQSFLWYQILIQSISLMPRSWRIGVTKLVSFLTRQSLIRSDEVKV